MTITKEGLFRYEALNERRRKNLLILEAIRKNGPISKADLTKQLGYNIVTLSNYIEEYLSKGLVYEKGLDVSSGGRRPALLDLNKKEIFLIGIDFNKETLKGLLTDFGLEVAAEVKMPRPTIEQEEVEKALSSLVEELLKKSGVIAAKVKFIAVGIYGIIGDRNGTIKGLDEEKGHSRATLYFTELKRKLEKEFNITTFFGTDALFAAFGERTQNPSAYAENMLYIFQDIGKGVIIRGEIYCSTGFGSVDIEGLTGSLSEDEKEKLREDSLYLRPWDSQMSLRKEAAKVIERGVGTKIVELLKGDLENLNDEVIIKASEEKDEVAKELIEGIGINLGVRISYLINLFSPQVVIVGGGIEKAGEPLFVQIRKTVEKLSLEKPRHVVKILPSILGERTVSLGAASVALREVFLEA